MAYAMDTDEALAFLGKYSRWHIVTYIMIALSTAFPACWQMLNVVFIGGIPDYFCNVTDNRTIPTLTSTEGVTSQDQCNVYTDFENGNDTEACPNGYSFQGDYGATIVTDWLLVCDHEYMKDLSQTICNVGVMIGAVLFTAIADKIGRKPVFLFTSWGMVICGVLLAVSPNFIFFCVVRFIMGTFQQGIMLTGFVLACEIFPADQRTFAGVFIQSTWGMGMMVMALLAYLIRDWRYLELALTLPWVVTILGFWLIPESVPWLVANGKPKRAEQIIKSAAKFNNVDLPPHLFEDESASLRERINPALLAAEDTNEKSNGGMDAEADIAPKENALTIFKHAKLRSYTLIMLCLWFVNSLVYFGLSLSTGDLAGDRYVNFFLSGVVEFVAYSHSIYILQKFGRRIPLCVYHLIAATGLIISILIPRKTAGGTDLSILIIIFNMIGKFGISSSFSEIFLYAGEIFPVNVRNVGLGVCSVGARIAGMLAPFSSTVMRQVPWLPAVLFGGLSIIVAGMALLLPETLGRSLPQNVAELDSWDRQRGRAKSFDVHAQQRKRSRARPSMDQ